jgi:hypothetical protein
MNHHDREADSRLQARAEQAEQQRIPASGDPALDGYRLVIRALKQPPAAQLPANFATKIAAAIPEAKETHSLEDWLMTLLLLVMAVAGLVYVQPVMASLSAQFRVNIPTLPWPLLGAAAVSVALAWALDRGAMNWWGNRRGT